MLVQELKNKVIRLKLEYEYEEDSACETEKLQKETDKEFRLAALEEQLAKK